MVVCRGPCNSAGEIGLLVVDCGVQRMAAVLVPLCSTHETIISASVSPTRTESSTRVKLSIRDNGEGNTATWKQVGKVMKSLVSKKQVW